MGYDMYLLKVDKRKLNPDELFWEVINNATISSVNSYYPVLRDFENSHTNIHWTYEEYNLVSENTFKEIVESLKTKLESPNTKWYKHEKSTTECVYNQIKDWLPLKENEVIYFEEDS